MRKLTLLAAIAVAIVVAGTAVAAFPQDNVKLYTGCLTGGGALTYVAEGDSPLQQCSSPKQVVKLSGGDITSVNTPSGSGLSGGNTNGAVTLTLDAGHSLPTGCTTGEVPKSTGSNAWNCGTDNDHTYTADGTTLGLSGNTFSIASGYRVKNNQPCDSGKFATGINESGELTCESPSTGGIHAYSKTIGTTVLAGETTLISQNLPPGNYLLFASVELVNRDVDGTDRYSKGRCAIPGYGTTTHVIVWPNQLVDETSATEGADSVSLSSALAGYSGGTVTLKCTEEEPDIDAFQATLTAIKVDSLN
jgi:hypothetical protein